MCGGGGKTPAVVQRDPKAEALQAGNEAALKANNETAARKSRFRKNTLLATGAQGVQSPAASSLLAMATAKDTLGS